MGNEVPNEESSGSRCVDRRRCKHRVSVSRAIRIRAGVAETPRCALRPPVRAGLFKATR
jgi:hypothetical protein